MSSAFIDTLKKNIDSLIAAAVGFFIIYLYTRHSGVGISPDSVTYRSVAHNIIDHHVARDFNGRPLTDFPVGYPIFLGLFIIITHLDPLSFAPLLNELMFAALLFMCGWMMEQFAVVSKWYKWMILGFLVISPCLLEIYSYMWSETLFILQLLLFMILIRRYLQTHHIKFLLVAAIITSFSCITRYAGITIVGAGLLFILLEKKLSTSRKIGHFFLFGSISMLLLVLNLARNKIVGGWATGPREKGLTSLWINLHYFGDVLSDWLPAFTYRFDWLLAIVCIIGLLIAWVVYYFRNKKQGSFEYILTTYFLIYAGFILFIATVSRFEELDSRLLSPLYIPLLLAGTCWMPRLVKKLASLKKVIFIVLSILFVLAFQANQLIEDYENYDGIKDAGVPGYTEDDWQYSPTVLFIKKNKGMLEQADTLYSDADDAVYFFTGLRGKLLPHKDDPAAIKRFVDCRSCFIIWFDDGANDDLLNMQEVKTIKHIQLLKKFDDGAVYVPENFTEDDSSEKK